MMAMESTVSRLKVTINAGLPVLFFDTMSLPLGASGGKPVQNPVQSRLQMLVVPAISYGIGFGASGEKFRI